MNLHEYQAKSLLARYGIPLAPFEVIRSEDEVDAALERLGTTEVILKVQIHAGGRGRAGGVKIAKNRDEAKTVAKSLLGLKIVNQQTGKQGVIAQKLLISPLASYQKEYYLGIAIDRKCGKPIIISSPEGGMEIEEIALNHPDRVLKTPIPLDGHLRNYQLWEIGKFLGWKDKSLTHGMHLIRQAAKAFIELDAALLEINPLVSLANGTFLALDAKLAIDDNALFRHKEIAEQFDATQISPLEAEALKHDLAYIALEGNIGCMVNGAGLAMATMDIIEFYGGKPANFLDVGGGASQDKVAEGFKIILSDPKVAAILVNIFGGIMNCETLAKGIIAALKEKTLTIPLVVRMEGTNVEQGKAVLSQSGLKITVANTLSEAAEKVVKACRS